MTGTRADIRLELLQSKDKDKNAVKDTPEARDYCVSKDASLPKHLIAQVATITTAI